MADEKKSDNKKTEGTYDQRVKAKKGKLSELKLSLKD